MNAEISGVHKLYDMLIFELTGIKAQQAHFDDCLDKVKVAQAEQRGATRMGVWVIGLIVSLGMFVEAWAHHH